MTHANVSDFRSLRKGDKVLLTHRHCGGTVRYIDGEMWYPDSFRCGVCSTEWEESYIDIMPSSVMTETFEVHNIEQTFRLELVVGEGERGLTYYHLVPALTLDPTPVNSIDPLWLL